MGEGLGRRDPKRVGSCVSLYPWCVQVTHTHTHTRTHAHTPSLTMCRALNTFLCDLVSRGQIGWDGRGSQTSRAGRGGEGTFTGRPASRGNAGRGTAGLDAPRVPHDGEGTDHVVLEDLGVGLDAEFLRLFAP